MKPTSELSSLTSAVEVERWRDRFEADLHADRTPRIEDYVAAAPYALHDPLLLALLTVEMERVTRRGNQPDLADYLERFPTDAKLVGLAFAETRKTNAPPKPQPASDLTVSVQTSDIGTSKGPSTIVTPNPSDAPPLKSPAAEPLSNQQQIGRFTVLGTLGQGAFGAVYRAHDPQLDRHVAIKVPRDGILNTAEDRQRFLREARAAATLNHPHVCPVYEVGEADGRPYIVMAVVEGKSLAEWIKSGKIISEPQAASAVRKIALALDEAHRKGIVHRDLKPANIIMNRRGEPVIMDFGLARLNAPDDVQLTTSGTIMGTPAYMSPEQARGDGKTIGPPSDIYSLGVVLYEMLCGRRPFEGTFAEVLGQILHVPPAPPSRYRASISPQLEPICLKAMAKEISARFGSMREFAQVLSEYLRWQEEEARRETAAETDSDSDEFHSGTDIMEHRSEAAPRKSDNGFRASEVAPRKSDPNARRSDSGPRKSDAAPRKSDPAERRSEPPARRSNDPVAGTMARAAARPKSVVKPKPQERAAPRITDKRAAERAAAWKRFARALVATLMLLASLAAFAAILFAVTNQGTIRIELSDPSAQVQATVDGNPVELSASEPLRLSPGEHELMVEGPGLETITRRLDVKRGRNPALLIELTPRASVEPQLPND